MLDAAQKRDDCFLRQGHDIVSDQHVSLARFAREVNRRSVGDPPGGRSPLLLALAVNRVTGRVGTPASRVLGALIVALSCDSGDFGPNDVLSLGREELAIAAELIEGRLADWWPQVEWDNARSLVEDVLAAWERSVSAR